MNEFSFDTGPGNWVSGNIDGAVANCYWSAGDLRMDGAGWGNNYWRYQVPSGVCAVWDTTTIHIHWTNAANCFANVALWDWNDYQFWYGQLYGTTSPQDVLFHKSGSAGKYPIKHIGIRNNINGGGYKLHEFQISGLYSCDYPGPGYGPEFDLQESKLHFSNVQFGSRLGSGVYVSGVSFDDEPAGIIQTSNVRLG